MKKDLLKTFLEGKTNHTVSDAELDAYLNLMSHLIKKGQRTSAEPASVPGKASSNPADGIEVNRDTRVKIRRSTLIDGATRYLVELQVRLQKSSVLNSIFLTL